MLVDDEMLFVMSHRKLRQIANSITSNPQPQKHVLLIVNDVELESDANVLMTVSHDVEGSPLILLPNQTRTLVQARK